MDLKTASRYTGIAYWTVRGLVIDGLIPRVVLPGKPDKDTRQPRLSRRILIHRDDLDAFFRARRERNVQPFGDDQPMTIAVKRTERRQKTNNASGRSDSRTAVPQ
jgi:hypothetical protein